MKSQPLGSVIDYIRRIADNPLGELTDEQLLDRFVRERDDKAFAALVRRHGPLVLSVCQRVLPNVQDAEDAFQATFLVLVRKAKSIAKRHSVASWLHGVARRIALRAKIGIARHFTVLSQTQPIIAPDCLRDVICHDLRRVLDEEVHRLPHKYREAFILCYMEGRTNEEAARLLNLPYGTVLSRLSRARERLRSRLVRRGLTLSAGLVATMLSHAAVSGEVSPALLRSTVRSAMLLAAGRGIVGVTASARIIPLAEEVLKGIAVTRFTSTIAYLLIASVVGLGTGGVLYRMMAKESPAVENQRTSNDYDQSPSESTDRLATAQPDSVEVTPAAEGKRTSTSDHRFRSEEVIAKSFAIKGSPRVVVESFNGAINVIAGSSGIVKARVIKRSQGNSEKAAKEDLKSIEVTMSQEGDTIRITARTPDEKIQIQRGAPIELQVPTEGHLELRTRNGDEIANMQGTVNNEPGKGFRLRTKNDADAR